jgi:acyl-CoA dehydrogenase
MDFEFPEDSLMLRDMLRKFLQKDARPLEMKYFNAGKLEPEEQARLRSAIEQMGLWAATVPEKLGGGGLDCVTACLIEEELGATFVPIELGDVPPLLLECSPEQAPRYLEAVVAGERRPVFAAREPGAVRPEGWQTRAAIDGEGYRLQGVKVLAAQPPDHSFYVVLANAPEGLTAFLIEQEHPGTSLRGDGQPTLVLEDCRVDRSAVLGQPGRALASNSEEASRAWIRWGARYVGMAQRLMEMAAEHAKDWVSLGEPLSVRPAIRRMLAEIRVDVEGARWLVYHAAWSADSGHDLRTSAAMVRQGTGEMLLRVIDRATMVFCGPGPAPAITPQRMVRSLVPPEALELALEYARSIVATDVLAAAGER